MTTLDEATATRLRYSFRYLNKFMLVMWRLGLGKLLNVWPRGSGQFMVITHVGRKTGLQRFTPVNFTTVDGDVYCTAGFGSISDWYRNIQAEPKVEIWLPDGWWTGLAEDVTGCEGHLFLLRQVLIASGFAAPLFGIHPLRMNDAELAEVSAEYRLVRIQPQQARTGPGGPGAWAWIWPLLTIVLMPLALRRRR